MLGALAIGGAAASLIASSLIGAHSAQVWPIGDVPPPSFTVGLVSVNGSGCPAGTAAVAVSPDDTAFTVSYSSYLAQTGGGAAPTDFRKNCQLDVRVNAPQGLTYAIAEADYRGYAYLASGASAQERANYYFQGESQTSSATHSFSGPMDDDWQASDVTGIASLVYAPCGETRNLNINTQLNVTAGSSDPSSTSFMTMDSTDGSLTTIYHLDWATCPTS
ncbi:DUF4360 domain-containing protein [Streptomyces sp. PTM05]|uniref:DUF4360 domain-containing protein n=1 Tax=Streptantibioticus parmotrematis TaxID=2873249 RepID=A0ABS7QL41_9ACTN|nr:DUF4360 domain-containing protein [Streptantibioticus parmotrematis]MBY8883912.1 DUF4360 domain-containing protein [Streptantibioticus parmotrematis]